MLQYAQKTSFTKLRSSRKRLSELLVSPPKRHSAPAPQQPVSNTLLSAQRIMQRSLSTLGNKPLPPHLPTHLKRLLTLSRAMLRVELPCGAPLSVRLNYLVQSLCWIACRYSGRRGILFKPPGIIVFQNTLPSPPWPRKVIADVLEFTGLVGHPGEQRGLFSGVCGGVF